ncbi:MAG: RidA family protein [Gemmatimonadales bacterium]|nr:MAG: RidA family protein [Gemmatimonadales bacterium]
MGTGCGPAPDPTPDSPAWSPPQAVESSDAPEAIGPYSQAIRAGGTLYLAGQIALDPATGEMVEGGIEAETRQVMENLAAVLAAAGMDFGHVVQTQVFLTDLADFAAMNEIYGSYLAPPYPARATVEVAGLPRGAVVEIQMVAVDGP